MGQGNWLLMGEEGEIKIWWGGEFIWRVIFVGGGGGGGNEQIFDCWPPPNPPCRENPEPGSQA